VGVRVLQQPAPHAQEDMGHRGREGHKRERNQANALAVGRKGRKQLWQIHSRSCTPTTGNAVETRWCIDAVHKIYLVLNYLIIEETLFF
jgi:hypothetical protein